MRQRQYDRELAVSYAHRWALGRNPQYGDFTDMGGDCTNFASQVLYAGAGVMNPAPTFGWYYYNLGARAPAWTGVEFLYQFLVHNNQAGPAAAETDLSRAQPGDLIQLSFDGTVFGHSPVVVAAGAYPSPRNILVAAHTYDVDYHPLYLYSYVRARCLHITHVNIW